jgi:hypothetical protein
MTTTPPPSSTRDRLLRLGLALLVAAAVVAFYLSGLYEYLYWDAVRARIETWQQLAGDHLPVALLIFFAVYVTATSLSLPVALILSLVGGALFGRWLGVGVVIVARRAGRRWRSSAAATSSATRSAGASATGWRRSTAASSATAPGTCSRCAWRRTCRTSSSTSPSA